MTNQNKARDEQSAPAAEQEHDIHDCRWIQCPQHSSAPSPAQEKPVAQEIEDRIEAFMRGGKFAPKIAEQLRHLLITGSLEKPDATDCTCTHHTDEERKAVSRACPVCLMFGASRRAAQEKLVGEAMNPRELKSGDRIRFGNYHPWTVVEVVERGVVLELPNGGHKHLTDFTTFEQYEKDPRLKPAKL